MTGFSGGSRFKIKKKMAGWTAFVQLGEVVWGEIKKMGNIQQPTFNSQRPRGTRCDAFVQGLGNHGPSSFVKPCQTLEIKKVRTASAFVRAHGTRSFAMMGAAKANDEGRKWETFNSQSRSAGQASLPQREPVIRLNPTGSECSIFFRGRKGSHLPATLRRVAGKCEEILLGQIPGVAPLSQPWAEGCNSVGVGNAVQKNFEKWMIFGEDDRSLRRIFS
ncbi:MAG TPA: hypothetical protein VG347_06725 [Verrucomicrobiae bacterium]|nr:hypothetical protein [Verrucomicrobiae bacterium]